MIFFALMFKEQKSFENENSNWTDLPCGSIFGFIFLMEMLQFSYHFGKS